MDDEIGDTSLGDRTRDVQLNVIGVLVRREIEARLLVPLLKALGEEFGRERVLEITRQVVEQISREQGAQLAERMGGCSLAHFAASLDNWKKDDAMQLDVLERSETEFSFNVTRCRYAEMYQELGLTEIGSILSCSRDFNLIQGFNPKVKLNRKQTIMEGALYCDFRFILSEGES
jgi:predicted ArsR family transcriptional regulator